MRKSIAAAVLLASVPGASWAQAFQPTRPVEIVVHNAPGGGSDVLARFMITLIDKQKLLPVRSHVTNRTGGGSATAMASACHPAISIDFGHEGALGMSEATAAIQTPSVRR